MKATFLIIVLFLWNSISFCQLVPIGLIGKKVTSLTKVENSYENLIVAGTESDGMYFHDLNDDDSVWIQGFFKNRSLSCVYAQPVSHSLTKLFMAMVPDSSNNYPLIYTNIMPIQSAIPAEDSGLDRSKINRIKSIAGFDFIEEDSVMPAFCCTNDPNIYVNRNRNWSLSWSGTETVTLNFVYTNDSTVWAGGFNNGLIGSALLLKSIDYGDTWEKLILPIGEVFSCYSICVSPNNPDIIFVGLNENILKSTDGGNSWKSCLSNIKNAVFTGILENPLKPGQIYAGGRYNDNSFVLFKSDDNGENWEQIGYYCNCIVKGINDMIVTVTNDNFVIYMGTDGDGIWKYSDKISSINNNDILNSEYYLYQNYPNPFNPETKISFEIPVNSIVTLKVYDLVGKEIAVLVNEKYLTAGFYSVVWDSKNLNGSPVPSGVYICRLASGNNVRIIKMILMR